MNGRGTDRPDRARITVPRTAAGERPPPPDGADAVPTDVDGARRDLWPAMCLGLLMVVAFVTTGLDGDRMMPWALSRAGLAAGEYAPLALHIFAHGGFIHLGFNLVALVMLTPPAMDRLGTRSPRGFLAFLALFFACGLGGAAFYLALPHTAPMLGASGAIFGLLGFVLRQPDPSGPPVPALGRETGGALWVFVKLHLPLLVIFAIPMLLGAGGFGLAWEAHLGGFIAGWLLNRSIGKIAGTGSPRAF